IHIPILQNEMNQTQGPHTGVISSLPPSSPTTARRLFWWRNLLIWILGNGRRRRNPDALVLGAGAAVALPSQANAAGSRTDWQGTPERAVDNIAVARSSDDASSHVRGRRCTLSSASIPTGARLIGKRITVDRPGPRVCRYIGGCACTGSQQARIIL